MTSVAAAGSSMAVLENVSSVEARLRKVQATVKKVTQEALKQQSSANNNDDDDDPNASFHLGMELFGQEVTVIERNVQEKLERMEEELEGLVIEVQNNQNNNENTRLLPENRSSIPQASEEENLEEQSKQLQIKIRFLKHCSAARALLDESVTLSTRALAPNEEVDLRQAAQLLVQAGNSLKAAQAIVVQENNNVTTKSSTALTAAFTILDAVQAAFRRQKVDLVAQATQLWHASVQLSADANTLTVRNNTTTGHLATAYDVLETLQQQPKKNSDNATSSHTSTALESILRKFTRTLHETVFQPAIDAHCAGKPLAKRTFHQQDEEAGSSSSSTVSVRRLEWSVDDVATTADNTSNNNNNMAAWSDTFAFIERILVFVADHVLLQRTSLEKFVAQRFFGKPNALLPKNALNLEATLGLESCRFGDDNGLLLEPLVDALEQTCIPRYLTGSELGQLGDMAKELSGFLDPFLQQVGTKHLLPNDQTRLSTFASSFEQKYVDNRRTVLLNEARNLLLENDYHNTVQVGEEVRQNSNDDIRDEMAVFKLHRASVSDTAFKIMALCRQIMDEAVDVSAAAGSTLSVLPATLYRTAREVLDLFRAVIPVTHGQEVAHVPRTAAVLHNDAVFLAHHCLTLGLEYKDKFAAPAVPADDVRGNLLRQTCMFLDMVPLFRDLADRSLGEMLDLQATQLQELVGERITLMGEALRSDEILAEWSETESALTAGLYHLNHLFQAWKPILSYDILNRSMCYLADVMFTLFLDQVAKAKDISANACQFVNTLFQKATHELEDLLYDKSVSRVWDRFSAVGRFMDMSLADIQVALADGVFRSVTGPELARLVTSCFDDSPKRQALLQALSSYQ